MKKIHHKRRRPRIDILFTFVISTLILGAGYLLFLSSNGSASPSKNKGHATAPPSTIDTMDSKYPGIKIISEISNDLDIPFAIQYPQSAHETFNDTIKTYIKKANNAYLTEIMEQQKPKNKLTAELNISFETYVHPSGLYSFVLLSDSSVEGANKTTEIRTFLLNPETGQSPTIEDILEHDVERLKNVATTVQGQLHKDLSIKDDLLANKIEEYTQPIWDNYRRFALTDDAIVFYFNPSEITTGSLDTPSVSIPLVTLNDLLAADYKGKEEKKPVGKRVALTFDDGPELNVTTQILETLKKYDAKATFFMLGSRVEYYPEIAKSVQAAGHELGNHSWNHPNLNKADINKIQEEINKTSAIIEEVTGQKATLFRPPYGAFNDTVKAQSDLPIALWDVDTLDWKHRNADQLLAHIKQHTKDGSIILMHDIHQSTADGLDAVLAYLQSEGYTFVTVSELN